MSVSSMTKTDLLPNPHPGHILLEEFLMPMGLSQNALARAVHVPPRRINEIVLGKRAMTADTDLRLARYFGLSEGFFLGLQADFDLMERRRQIEPRGVRALSASHGTCATAVNCGDRRSITERHVA